MDVELFWDDITFTPLYKEKGMWVMGALVDSGVQVQLMVISKNKAPKLVDMEWMFIYGILPDGQFKRSQYFDYPPVLTKVLIVKTRDFKETTYLHKYERYLVIKKHDPRILDTVQCEDEAKIMEIFSQPGFTIQNTDFLGE